MIINPSNKWLRDKWKRSEKVYHNHELGNYRNTMGCSNKDPNKQYLNTNIKSTY